MKGTTITCPCTVFEAELNAKTGNTDMVCRQEDQLSVLPVN
jgi:hypothetical protein